MSLPTDQSLTRRRLLTGLGTAGVAGLAGCAGLSGPVTFESTPATVSGEVLSGTSYEHYRTTRPVTTREVSAFGLSKRVEVTNAVAEYDRAIDLGTFGLGRYRAAVCAVLSTPQISYLGRTFNPVGELSADELAAMLQERYGNLRELTPTESFSTMMLATMTTVTQYEGTAVLIDDGVEIDVSVLIAEPVVHEEDFVLTVAVSPQLLEERSQFEQLFSGVTH
jgi:hypothetical protein